MRRRSDSKKPADLIEVAVQVVQTVAKIVTDPEPLDVLPPADLVPEAPRVPSTADIAADTGLSAKTAGKSRGPNGGTARANKLTAEERREIARKAAAARWKRKKGTA